MRQFEIPRLRRHDITDIFTNPLTLKKIYDGKIHPKECISTSSLIKSITESKRKRRTPGKVGMNLTICQAEGWFFRGMNLHVSQMRHPVRETFPRLPKTLLQTSHETPRISSGNASSSLPGSTRKRMSIVGNAFVNIDNCR